MDFENVCGTLEKLLAPYRLDGYEIMIGSSRNLSLEVKEQKVDTFKCSTPVGISIRILKNHGMGFSFSTSLDSAPLTRMIENALVAAEMQTPDEFHTFPHPAPYPVIDDMFDHELAAIGEEAKIRRAMDLERLTLSADRRIRKVRKSSYGEASYEVYLHNSNGVTGHYRGTSVSSSVTVIAEEGSDSQMGWDFGFSTRYGGVDVDRIAASAAEKATGLLGAEKIATMRCPAVLDTYVATQILEVLAPAFLAESVQKKKSLLAGKVGATLFSPLLTIRDDGTFPGGMATTPCDGEGVPQQNTPLVTDGIVRGFLYDTYWALRDKTASTGNAARGGVKGAPHMGVTNFFIEPGTRPATALLEGIGRGILVTEVMGMHTANPISGDFSVGAAGFLIENGEKARPVKGIAIAGNIVDLFRNVEGIGSDLRFFGAVGAPSLRIGALDVSGT